MSTYRHLSMWWDTLPDDLAGPSRPMLTDDIQADVVVVGAGYTGLWTAYYLLTQQPDLRIVVLDAQVAGYGASGRNGGWLSALFPASWEAVARRSTMGEAQRLQRELFHTVDEVLRVIDHEGIRARAAKGGTVVAARTPAQVERAHAEIDNARAFGFDEDDYRWLDPTDAAALIGTTNLKGATYTPHCAAIHPARLVRGLAQVVERHGATIFEHSPVIDLAPGKVRTPYGTVRAPFVVRATEGYTAGLPEHRRKIAPVYSLMVATEPLPEQTWDEIGLAQRETFADHRHLIIYGQRTADDRMAFGGRGAPYHFGSRIDPMFDRETSVFDDLRATLRELFPVLNDATFTHQWGGPLGVPRDWYASVGLDRRTGLAHAGGYVGDGVGTSNLAGRTLADLILEQPTDIVTLPWVQHRSPQWEPEPIRWIGVNAGLRIMATADEAEDRTGQTPALVRWMGRLTGH